jgi:hypothetical protein
MTTIDIRRPSYDNAKPLTALRAASNAYGVSLPSVVTSALDKQAEVTRLLASVPENDYDLNTAVLTADDIEAAVEEAAREVARRDAVRSMNRGQALANRVRALVSDVLADAYGDLWRSIVPSVEKDVVTIEKHASNLPADSLDPAAVLAHNGGAKAYAAVEPVLSRVGIALNAMPRPRSDTPRTLPAPVARALWVVEVPEVEPQTKIGPWESDHTSPEQQEQRTVLHRFRAAVETDARAALVDVARGAFPGVSLSVASDADQVTERARRFALSQVIVKHRDGDRDAPSGVVL